MMSMSHPHCCVDGRNVNGWQMNAFESSFYLAILNLHSVENTSDIGLDGSRLFC